MPQQETATDRLVSVIQSIQMAQEDGVLSVRRGEGGTLEEGTIVFVNGQVKQANVGRRSGVQALNWLSTWGQCRYMFASAESATFNQTQPLNSIPSPNPGNTRSTTTNPRLGVQRAPSQKQSGPLLPYFSSRWERTTPLPSSQTSLIVY